MASTPTTRLRLSKPATNDTGWGDTVNADLDALDALAPLGGLNVAATESPSTTLNVRVGSGTYRKADGTVGTYAGTTSRAMTAGSTNYVYLTDGGTLTVSTSAFPATPHVRLATVTTGTAAVTAVSDARLAGVGVQPGGAWWAVTTVTTTYTATAADGFIRADATAAAFTITLPDPATVPGKEYFIKRVNSAANNVTVATAAGTFDGAATKVIGAQYSALKVVSTGSVWAIMSTLGTVT